MALKDQKVLRKISGFIKEEDECKIGRNEDLYQQLDSMTTVMMKEEKPSTLTYLRSLTKDSPLRLSTPSIQHLDINPCKGYLPTTKINKNYREHQTLLSQ